MPPNTPPAARLRAAARRAQRPGQQQECVAAAPCAAGRRCRAAWGRLWGARALCGPRPPRGSAGAQSWWGGLWTRFQLCWRRWQARCPWPRWRPRDGMLPAPRRRVPASRAGGRVWPRRQPPTPGAWGGAGLGRSLQALLAPFAAPQLGTAPPSPPHPPRPLRRRPPPRQSPLRARRPASAGEKGARPGTGRASCPLQPPLAPGQPRGRQGESSCRDPRTLCRCRCRCRWWSRRRLWAGQQPLPPPFHALPDAAAAAVRSAFCPRWGGGPARHCPSVQLRGTLLSVENATPSPPLGALVAALLPTASPPPRWPARVAGRATRSLASRPSAPQVRLPPRRWTAGHRAGTPPHVPPTRKRPVRRGGAAMRPCSHRGPPAPPRWNLLQRAGARGPAPGTG